MLGELAGRERIVMSRSANQSVLVLPYTSYESSPRTKTGYLPSFSKQRIFLYLMHIFLPHCPSNPLFMKMARHITSKIATLFYDSLLHLSSSQNISIAMKKQSKTLDNQRQERQRTEGSPSEMHIDFFTKGAAAGFGKVLLPLNNLSDDS